MEDHCCETATASASGAARGAFRAANSSSDSSFEDSATNSFKFDDSPAPCHRQLLSSQYSDDFTCGVCFDIMIEPSTLQCGHSFCRHCLAQWYLSSKMMICPTCRQEITALPNVSVALR